MIIERQISEGEVRMNAMKVGSCDSWTRKKWSM